MGRDGGAFDVAIDGTYDGRHRTGIDDIGASERMAIAQGRDGFAGARTGFLFYFIGW
jgi:hypothetical protein